MERRSKITPAARARKKAAGHEAWHAEQIAKGKTARQRLAAAIAQRDPGEDVPDAEDSAVRREAVLT